jgi:hypothetical protein
VHKVLQSSPCIKVNIQQEQKQPKKQLLTHGLDFQFTQSRLQPPPASTYRVEADVHDNMSPTRRQQIVEMRRYLRQLEDPNYRSTYRPSDQASYFRTTAQGQHNQPPPSYNQQPQERGRSPARRQQPGFKNDSSQYIHSTVLYDFG